MSNNNKIQTGINNISNEWFRANIDRKTLKNLSKRTDYEGWKHIIIFTLSLTGLGILSAYFWQTWWFIPLYLVYCMFWGGADAIWHECGHRTAFRTRKLNDLFYHIASFMNNFEPVRWRWSHSLHHSYTASVDPHDYEADGSIFSKHTLFSFLINFIPGIGFFTIHKSLYIEIIQHALGIKTDVMRDCIPEDKIKDCINSSRIFVLLWISIIAISIYFASLLPILLFLVPKFFATFNGIWGLTQHMGLQENTKDHRLSTRSVRLNPIFSFIYWKMEYHIEHHMFPMVPSYNLKKLRNESDNALPKPFSSLFDFYKKVLPAVIALATDQNKYYKVKLNN